MSKGLELGSLIHTGMKNVIIELRYKSNMELLY